jgi:argininosuccinate lyase
MDRMLRLARQKLAEQDGWIAARRARIDSSLARLDADFDQLLKTAN